MSETDSATIDTNAEAGAADTPKEAATAAVLTGDDAGKTEAAAEKTAEPAKAEGEQGKSGEKSEDKPKDGVPETYEFVLPESMKADDALVGEFVPLAKELGLSQESAQKLVDLYSAKILPGLEARRAEVWAQTQVDWANAARTDKEFGGDAFDANVAVANKAVAQFGTPAFVEALKATGAGNHPEFVRFCYRVGKAISEDTVVTGAQGGGQKSAEDVLFPTMANG